MNWILYAIYQEWDYRRRVKRTDRIVDAIIKDIIENEDCKGK